MISVRKVLSSRRHLAGHENHSVCRLLPRRLSLASVLSPFLPFGSFSGLASSGTCQNLRTLRLLLSCQRLICEQSHSWEQLLIPWPSRSGTSTLGNPPLGRLHSGTHCFGSFHPENFFGSSFGSISLCFGLTFRLRVLIFHIFYRTLRLGVQLASLREPWLSSAA